MPVVSVLPLPRLRCMFTLTACTHTTSSDHATRAPANAPDTEHEHTTRAPAPAFAQYRIRDACATHAIAHMHMIALATHACQYTYLLPYQGMPSGCDIILHPSHSVGTIAHAQQTHGRQATATMASIVYGSSCPFLVPLHFTSDARAHRQPCACTCLRHLLRPHHDLDTTTSTTKTAQQRPRQRPRRARRRPTTTTSTTTNT